MFEVRYRSSGHDAAVLGSVQSRGLRKRVRVFVFFE